LQEKPRERKKQGLFLIEGIREIRLALLAGFSIKTLLHCPDLAGPEASGELPGNAIDAEWVACSVEVFNRVAYRKDTGGLLAVSEQKRISFGDLRLSENPLILVLESVEKPGNLGAVLRTADAAGLDAVILCDPQTDLFNPNTIRSSIGCIFTLPVITATSAETLDWLKKNQIHSFGTALTAKKFYYDSGLNRPCAVIMGTEATGLSPTWLEGADELIRIPMRGRIDSMNVSVSAAIVVFEALRQRNFR
jgi:TrmH family RNA methyltransferase